MKTLRRTHLWILLVLLLVGVTGHGQRNRSGQENNAQGVFAERIEVRVVDLEAVVTDRDGHRISGLKSGDFRLTVDGKEIPIDFFTEIEGGWAVERKVDEEGQETVAVPAGIEPGKPVGTSYLLFVDNFLTTVARDRNRILEQIESEIGQLGPEDRMAIVAFDGRKLEMVSNWTNSSQDLTRAFAEARGLPVVGFSTDQPIRQTDRGRVADASAASVYSDPSSSAGGGESPAQPRMPTEMFREDGLPLDICNNISIMEERVERVILGATATLRTFGRPPGRKAMILLSGGWPHDVKDFMVGAMTPNSAAECISKGPRIYRPVFDTANLLGYTLYPVDVPAREPAAIGVESASGNLFGSTLPSPRERQMLRQDEVHSSLERLAVETGGQAMLDGASLAAFETTVADTRSYYWLGFTPTWKGDDKSHSVKLEVLLEGLNVRSRKSFQDLSRNSEISFITESALLFGDLPGSMPLGLRVGEYKKGRGMGKLKIPLEVVIPMDAIVMLPKGDHFEADLELRVSVLDEQGNRNDMPVIPVALAGPEPPPGSHAIYETSVRIRRQKHDIVVSLYDPLSDTVLAASTSVEP